MHSIATTRRYELFIVLAAAAAYVIRRLFELAENFNLDIRLAQAAGASNAAILRDLASFDYNRNVIFPTVAGAVFFVGAWYVIHYHAFPRINEKKYDSKTNWLIALTIGLTLGSILLYSFFRLELIARPNSSGKTVGFWVVATFMNIPIATIAALMTLFVYETFAQIYYHTIKLYDRGHSQNRVLQYVLLVLAGACVCSWIFVGQIADFAVGRNGGVFAGIFIIILTLISHQFFYSRVLPYLAKYWQNKSDKPVYTFAVLIYNLVSLLLFYVWMRHIGGDPSVFIAICILPTGVGLLTAMMRRSLFTETRQLQTQVLQKTTELDTLRSQVNPHFLFNALNTLYSVALKESSEKTADGIQKLGDMMRFMLHENNQERIPLRKEIEYLHNFLDLQRMRLDEGHEIEIRVNIQEPEAEKYLAPMLLNPFVENAFKHGISLRQPSWIYLTLTLDATKLYFKVHNSLHQKTGDDPEKNGSGIGLENVRKRLDLLYPNRHTLDIQATESDYFVSLILETDQSA